jgi:hypothetical protein
MGDALATSLRGRHPPRGRVFPLVCILLLLPPRPLPAQGVTAAALQGRVLQPDSMGIEDATILVTNTTNGERWQTVSHAKGRYSLEQLSIGGPYLVEVRAVGYAPAGRSGLALALGQRLTADFTLSPVAYELSGITVTAAVDPLINAGRTGPAYSVPESTAARVPVFDRDFLRLALLSPRVTRTPSGGLSIAGQPDRLNAVQIDGATNQDMLGTSGIGGIQVLGARTLSVDAIQELQVISAPFDVRYGNFAAGLINAVTRSGTNRWGGSTGGFYSDRGLVGKDAAGRRGDDFVNKEVTMTLGGPIVRNRAAFFLDAGLQRRVFPENDSLLGTTADTVGGVTIAEALRFRDILRDTYGVDAGEIGPHPLRIPAVNLLGKVSVQLGVNSRLELSQAYSRSHLTIQVDRGDFGVYTLTSRAFDLPVRSHSTRLGWTTTFGGRYSNELTLARQQAGFHCESAGNFAIVEVQTSGNPLSAGGSCLEALVRSSDIQQQNLLELTDNFTIPAGAHRLTFGTHDERLRLADLPILDHFFGTTWTFGSLDALEAGQVQSYQAVLRTPERSSGPLSHPLITQVGGYAQDQWNPIPRLTLTAGVRLDVPYVSRAPPRNDSLRAALGIDNTLTPSGHPLWAPRLGVNYDVTGRGSTYLRGGIGWFAGRPAYKWFVAVDAHTGLEAYSLFCEGENAPAFILDPARQPTSCAGERQPQAGPINVFDPGFRFPRNLKLAFGADQRLPGGVVGTVDLLYTQAVNQFNLIDRNLQPPESRATGEDGRLMYGSVGDQGQGEPRRRNNQFGQVIAVGNARGDRAYSVTSQLQKRFANGTAIEASYTYSRSRDRLSSDADNTEADLDEAVIDGSLVHRRLATALWNVPHRVTLLATANLPFGFRGAFFYEGLSGTPFTYGIAGDANADGLAGNDIMYIPRDARPGGDVELVVPDEKSGEFLPAPAAEYAALANTIGDEGCLRRQRGHILHRNSCRESWSNHADARLSRVFSTFQGQSLELTLDIFNVLHLVNPDWGLVRGSDAAVLELVGYDPAGGRGVYQRLPVRRFIKEENSRWRLQLGARYTF